MENLPQAPKSNANRWIGRIDRAAQQLNATLVVLAIGLAALDCTCYVAIKICDAIPAAPASAGPPVDKVAMPARQPVAALTPATSAPATARR